MRLGIYSRDMCEVVLRADVAYFIFGRMECGCGRQL